MRINHNISSMIGQSALYKANAGLSQSLTRLSTGLRINSAADDAAGLGVSENLRKHVIGMQQALKNTQDAISLLNIADGALNEQADLLQRMRELVIQAKNDTYSQTERDYMGREFDSMFHELDRIAAVTNFNTQQIFASPEQNAQGTAPPGQTLYANDNLNNSPHVLTDERNVFTDPTKTIFGANDYASSTHFNMMVGADYTADDVAAYRSSSASWDPSASNMITIQFGQMDTNALFSPAPDIVQAASLLETPEAGGSVNPFGWDTTQSPDQDISAAIVSHTATIQDKLSLILNLIDGTPVDPELEAAFFTGGTGNGTNLTGLQRVNTMRSDIGAMTNRLEHSVNNLMNQAAATQSAESVIRDVDFASETATFTKNQILSQSATAMLAQANALPSAMLKLIQ